jgi:hypothetical protein
LRGGDYPRTVTANASALWYNRHNQGKSCTPTAEKYPAGKKHSLSLKTGVEKRRNDSMKKALALALVLVLALSLAACGGGSSNSGGNSTAPPTSGNTTDNSQGADATPGGTASTPSGNSGLVSKAGDTASYGTYDGKPVEWVALAVDTSDKEHPKALLIAKDCIAMLPFLAAGSGNVEEAT